jgi:integrase
LDNILADVRRGIWRPPVDEKVDPPVSLSEATFHEFSSEWFATRESEGLAAKTITDLRWSLSNHLLPFFAGHRLSEITPQEIDRFKVGKVRERQELDAARSRGEKAPRRLSNNSINHVLSDLSQVLETAVEYGLLTQNPAAGKRRRLKSDRPNRPWVEPEALPSLLDAASGVGRVLLAGAGLRIGEALALRRTRGTSPLAGRVGLHRAGRLRPPHFDRTQAQPLEPTPWRARTCAVEAANIELAKSGIAPIDKQLGFHGLRRTYASLRCASGDDVAYTSAQIGHSDPRFTLRCYTQATRRRDRLSGPHRKAYDRALHWAQMGTNSVSDDEPIPVEATKNPAKPVA